MQNDGASTPPRGGVEFDPVENLKENIHWLSLRARLPDDDLSVVFKTEAERRARLISVRWPGGVACPKCQQMDVLDMQERRVFHCRTCKHQFSATSDTALHRTKFGLDLWFSAAEFVIRAKIIGLHSTTKSIADQFHTCYSAAHRVRTILHNDLERDGVGLLREAICVKSVVVPAEIATGSDDHCRWLLGRWINHPSNHAVKRLRAATLLS